MSDNKNINNIDEDHVSKIVNTIAKRGYAVTKGMPGQFIIDHNSFLISEERVPADMHGKIIIHPMFEYREQVPDKKDNTKAIEAAEQGFKSFCVTNAIKYNSKTFYKYQLIYFNGAAAAIGEMCTKWYVGLAGSRPIIENYFKK